MRNLEQHTVESAANAAVCNGAAGRDPSLEKLHDTIKHLSGYGKTRTIEEKYVKYGKEIRNHKERGVYAKEAPESP